MQNNHSIDERYLNSVCKVRSMENAILTAGYIREITDTYITIHNEPEIPSIINYNKKVKLSILNGKLGYKTLIATVYTSTNKVLKLCDIQEMDEFEKRTFYRVNVSLDGIVTIHPVSKDAENEEGQSYLATIENVSLSGVLLKCSYKLKLRDRISVTLITPFGKLEFLSVVRRIETNDTDQTDAYGCEFEEYPDRLGDALWKYMMYKEREDIRKAKGGWSVRD